MTDMKKINDLLKEKGIDRESLAHELGVTVAEVSRILSGKRRIRVDHLEVIAEMIGTHPAIFLIDDPASFLSGWAKTCHQVFAT